MTLCSLLDYFKTFVTFVANTTSKAVDVSMLWGLLFMVIRIREFSFESQSELSKADIS